ncbi:polyphenol oxidase family protein [Atopobium fossor]|uniref:polyphenol oxidase family protein n=1 Tax=Atopobium fossor TaxID=39487 RepID=UPI0004832BF3|nr:polyphenol oxidase family protein [Atopobium fossor]
MFPRVSEYESCGVTLLGDTACPAGVTLAFSQRHGGFSAAPYASLNVGAHVGDDPKMVQKNRELVLKAMGHEEFASNLVVPHQVHGSTVCTISSIEQISAFRERIAQGCDAIVCTTPQVPVLLCYADCTPVILVATQGTKPGFAVIHSGWRGTFARIAAAALQELCAQTASMPQNVLAYIGPHISGADYEVSSELLQKFVTEFGQDVCVGQHNLNMSAAIKISLLAVGLSSKHFVDCERSTASEVDKFFSYRAEQGVCGRHGALAFLA